MEDKKGAKERGRIRVRRGREESKEFERIR